VSTIAAIQMTSGHVVEDNLAVARKLLREAKERGADIACLPENFSFIGLRDADKLAVAEADGDGPVQRFLSATARELKLWILGGSTVIKGDDAQRVTNTSLLIDADGRRVARYDKIHLFDVAIPGRNEQYLESRHVAPGDAIVLADTPSGGSECPFATTCAFPSCTANWWREARSGCRRRQRSPCRTGRAHWETLLRARAIENLCYVAAPAQSGTHTSGRETYGDTLIVDYWARC